MSLSTIGRGFGFFAALAACGATIAFSLPRLEAGTAGAETGSEPVYLPKADYLRLISLGYDNVLADVLWFRTISYFGKHYRSDRAYPWLAHMCDLVTDLDPKAEHVYRFAGMLLPWEANEAEAGIRLLEKGTKVFPDSWLLYYWTGFNYYFFLDDLGTAADYLARAARLPDAHPSVAKLAALLASKHYGPEATLGFLSDLKGDLYTDEMREVVDTHMREARLAADLEVLNRAVDAHRERHGAPPESLAALVDDGTLEAIPADPFGGVYEINAETGKVRSSTGHKVSALYKSRLRQKMLGGREKNG